MEIDDLFGHEPLSKRTRFLLEDYVRDAFRAARYNFNMAGGPRATWNDPASPSREFSLSKIRNSRSRFPVLIVIG